MPLFMPLFWPLLVLYIRYPVELHLVSNGTCLRIMFL